MTELLITMQQIANYEGWGLKSALIAAVISLAGAVAYLYTSKDKRLQEQSIKYQGLIKDKEMKYDQLIKDKDDRLMQLITEHKNDMRDSNNDFRSLLNKYNEFTTQLEKIVNANNG